MPATRVRNDELDASPRTDTRFGWITAAAVNVTFGWGAISAAFSGTMLSTSTSFGDLATMTRASTGEILLAQAAAAFGARRLGYAGTVAQADLAGAPIVLLSGSVDGAFFGPNAVKISGAFRVVRGIPDQHLEISGSFVGATP